MTPTIPQRTGLLIVAERYDPYRGIFVCALSDGSVREMSAQMMEYRGFDRCWPAATAKRED